MAQVKVREYKSMYEKYKPAVLKIRAKMNPACCSNVALLELASAEGFLNIAFALLFILSYAVNKVWSNR